MPELPEVETIRRQLHARLAGAKIVSVEVWRSGREFPRSRKFVNALVGQRVTALERRAKLLVWRLRSGGALIAHLKMTGRFVFVDDAYRRDKHDRVRFTFEKNRRRHTLVWSDVRQFGFLKIVDNAGLESILGTYGLEPLTVSVDRLAEALHVSSTRTIKALLLDQSVIAGIGNIYADESLHRAGIRPTRCASRLTSHERTRLAQAVQTVLRESLKQRGTSANDYVDTAGDRGGFLKLLRVYGRAGEPCYTCGSTIKKIVCAQRGTHYCPRCQRLGLRFEE